MFPECTAFSLWDWPKGRQGSDRQRFRGGMVPADHPSPGADRQCEGERGSFSPANPRISSHFLAFWRPASDFSGETPRRRARRVGKFHIAVVSGLMRSAVDSSVLHPGRPAQIARGDLSVRTQRYRHQMPTLFVTTLHSVNGKQGSCCLARCRCQWEWLALTMIKSDGILGA